MTDPQTLQRAHRDYQESRILSAHPVEVVHMLYQVAIDSLNAAILHLKNGDRAERTAAVTKAELAVDELVLALDHSVNPSYSQTLAALYRYVLQQIISGNARQEEQPFQEALSILKTLSSAWSVVKDRVCATDSAANAVEPEEPEPEQQQPVRGPSTAYAQTPPDSAPSRDWSC